MSELPPRNPERTERGTRLHDTVSVGEILPELEVVLTPTRIIAGAIASRDFQEVHHNVAKARERGTPDIFMNILTTNGWVGRYVTDWAGPDARLEAVDIRLGAPNFSNDTMTLSGQVTRTWSERGEGRVEVAIRGRNRLGDHVNGKVRLALPTRG